jgi:ribosomal-protein-alanine N-acetyltransferase
VLRRLTADDLEALAMLEGQAGSHPWSRESLAGALSDVDIRVFGIDDTPGLAAYALVARLPFEAELQRILVTESCRRRGWGTVLLDAVIKQAHRWQSERLLLEVRADNEGAIGLYRRRGFLEEGRRRNYYPPETPGASREDAVLMSLVLR